MHLSMWSILYRRLVTRGYLPHLWLRGGDIAPLDCATHNPHSSVTSNFLESNKS